MSPEQKTASDEYLAAVDALQEARQRADAARREETACRNAVTEAERIMNKKQEAFLKAFGISDR